MPKTSLPKKPASGVTSGAAEKARTPLYVKVVSIIRQRIADNTYPAGSVMPAEDELANELDVSRHTIREALRRLREEGLVSSRQGAGTVVSLANRRTTYVQEVDSVQDLIQYAKTIRYQVNSTTFVNCTKSLATAIGAEVDSRWLRIEGLRYTEKGDIPVCKTDVYVNSDYSGVARMVARGHTAIYEMIEDLYGEKIAEVHQSFRGLDATKAVAAQLGIEAGDALVEIKRTYFTATGKVAEIAVNLYPYKRFSFAMKLKSAHGQRS